MLSTYYIILVHQFIGKENIVMDKWMKANIVYD